MGVENVLDKVNGWVLIVTAFVALILLLVHKTQRGQKKDVRGVKECSNLRETAAAHDERAKAYRQPELEPEELPNHPHLQGCFIPYSGEFITSPNKSNRSNEFENDMCVGQSIMIHRATWDAALNKSGNYPFGHVFVGRKINWEVRVQLRLKKTPDGVLKFGIELDDHVPLMASTRAAMKAVVAALKWIVGDDLYHSTGDDPLTTLGEVERPIFSMPLWAFDQFIETPIDEEPPSLTDPNFMQLGINRSDSTFIETLKNLKCKVGPTYTLAFNSISPLIDNINWTIGGVIPGLTVGFNQFCGRPPVHVAIYALRKLPAGSKDDHRHLDSRKSYLFHMAFWSSKCMPPRHRLRELLPSSSAIAVEKRPTASMRKGPANEQRFPESRKNGLSVPSRSLGLQGAALRCEPVKQREQIKEACLACFQGLRPSSVGCYPRLSSAGCFPVRGT